MYVYDRANALAQDIRQCQEFQAYKALKDQVMADQGAWQLITQFKSLQLAAQAEYLAGKEPDKETLEKLQKMGEVLQFNPTVAEYFAAEYKFHTIVSDIYRIIGDACEIDTSMFDSQGGAR